MTLREIISKFNIPIKDERIRKLGYYVCYSRFYRLMKKEKLTIEKVKEGEFMVINYPNKFTDSIKDQILYFLKKYPGSKLKRKRIEKMESTE